MIQYIHHSKYSHMATLGKRNEKNSILHMEFFTNLHKNQLSICRQIE